MNCSGSSRPWFFPDLDFHVKFGVIGVDLFLLSNYHILWLFVTSNYFLTILTFSSTHGAPLDVSTERPAPTVATSSPPPMVMTIESVTASHCNAVPSTFNTMQPAYPFYFANDPSVYNSHPALHLYGPLGPYL